MKNINGNNIQFAVGKDIMDENFPVIAGSEHILKSINESCRLTGKMG